VCAGGTDHVWEEVIEARAVRGYGCPFCANQRVSKTNALATTHPKLARAWHHHRNGTLTPREVVAGSNQVVWWKCKKGIDHEWRAMVANRVAGGGCPFCSNKAVSITNSLATCFPNIASDWHPVKNGKLTPSNVVGTSLRKVWWKCPRGPDHEWATMIVHRTSHRSGCPFCAGKKVSITNCLLTVCPDLAVEWHPRKNGRLTPKAVTTGSSKRVWWKCPLGPDHEWEITINKRARLGRGCPFCAGRLVSVTNSLASIFPEVAASWHPSRNGAIRPEDVLCGSKDSYWWLCARRHSWRAPVRERTVKTRGCPICREELR
jgi:hypothetical protein